MKDLDHKYAKEYIRLQQTVKEVNIINELIENRIKDKILDGYFDWKEYIVFEKSIFFQDS